ncbi:hypothetical protein TRFO_17813 [Tritrichomonas foetus]|uniref:Cilia- and flagella-associated protein 206 n=1 Tax=Tritrichomonas foetus TaxID=1144522 RepID=A0A1J4KM19_9EUKA|nr:hypothetical protein TRFO_17813 [Tritrichomonas foetus]|eukprot:OHT12345.1 hypothetical protein TRFO_17813 [Tritrichomonas foetus]
MEDSIIAIVQTLTDECSAHNIEATPALIAYTVRSIISRNIDDYQIDVSQPLDEEKTVKLHNEALELLQDPESLPMLTIRMQVDMDLGLAQSERSQKQREDRENEHRSAIEQELITTRARSTTALESLYRKIVSYTIISSKWGSPNDPQCVRQATAALEQVFPPSDLSKFIAGSDDDKRKHLQEVSKLVLGVRVFQTFGGDMADPSTNLRLEIPKKLDALKNRIQQSIDNINSTIIQYNEQLKPDPKPGEPREMIQLRRRLTDELANRQQFLFFYELLLNRLREVSKSIEQSCVEFDSLIENLRGLMELSDSVPTAKAFPIFSALSVVWMSFKSAEDQIKSFELLLARLRKHRDTFNYSINEKAESPTTSRQAVQQTEVKFDDPNAPPIPKESEVVADDSQPVLVQRDADGEFAFNGFCPVTLVERDGLLLPGDVVLGSIKWERKYYAFVDQDKRAKFQQDPAKWHQEAIAVAKKHPELVSLLGLQAEFQNLHAPKIPVKAKVPEPPNSKYRDAGIETELHPIESYIDRTYHWNQWELMKRKKILKGLENKRTKGNQTDTSHFRRETQIQTVEKRDKNEQTRVDSGVAMPKTVRYIAGLRGDTQTKATVVTMTLDLNK